MSDAFFVRVGKEAQRRAAEQAQLIAEKTARAEAAAYHAKIRPQLIAKYTSEIVDLITANIIDRFASPDVEDLQFDHFYDDEGRAVEDRTLLAEIVEAVRRETGNHWNMWHKSGRMIIYISSIATCADYGSPLLRE